MSQEIINIGTVANDGTGDPLRTAFNKTNNNFTELYNSQYFTVSSTGAASFALNPGNAGFYIRTTSATAVTITLSNASWVTNTEIIVEQAGAGQITFVADSGVVINTSVSLKSAAQYAVVGIKLVSSNTFTIFGERE